MLISLSPSRDLGTFIGNFFHREQSVGEIRGLVRLQSIISERKLELERKLNPTKEEPEQLD